LQERHFVLTATELLYFVDFASREKPSGVLSHRR
jgi:hypothetical protein